MPVTLPQERRLLCGGVTANPEPESGPIVESARNTIRSSVPLQQLDPLLPFTGRSGDDSQRSFSCLHVDTKWRFDHAPTSTSGGGLESFPSALDTHLLARLRKRGWLDEAKSAAGLDARVTLAQDELSKPCADASDDLPSLQEEASSAARRGAAINDCMIYSTTFPCHKCARHIVAAGLEKVVFIEPYPKSRVSVMFDDSIIVDGADGKRVPFVPHIGVAPGMYLQVFSAPRRKNEDGSLVQWEAVRQTQMPRVTSDDYGYIQLEDDGMATFLELLKTKLPGTAAPGDANGSEN